MRVVLAEDSVLVREGLARLLVAGIEVTRAVPDADSLLATVGAEGGDGVAGSVNIDAGRSGGYGASQATPGRGVVSRPTHRATSWPSGRTSTAPAGSRPSAAAV
jgi:hypothetical protein